MSDSILTEIKKFNQMWSFLTQWKPNSFKNRIWHHYCYRNVVLYRLITKFIPFLLQDVTDVFVYPYHKASSLNSWKISSWKFTYCGTSSLFCLWELDNPSKLNPSQLGRAMVFSYFWTYKPSKLLIFFA